MEIKPDNLLSVRVGRVVSKNVDVSSFISSEEYARYFSNSSIDNLVLPNQFKNDWLVIPNPYSTLHLGEMFSFYLTCTNDSIQEPMINVSVRIDIQTNNRAIFLKELVTEKLDAKASLDAILTHEIKEAHIHVIICTLSFNLADYERQTCRKYFQLSIEKPIDIRTKFYYTEYEEIYLEATFENLTNLPLQLKSVVLDSQNYDHKSLNYNLESKDELIFGKINRFNPTDSRQYLFALAPKKDIPLDSPALNTIGKLDIIWYSGIGVRGHIQTSVVEKSAKQGNIKVYIEDMPTETKLKQIFPIKLRIMNFSTKTVEPVVNFVNDEYQNILWLGLASENIGELKQSQSKEITMNLYPIKLGLFSIPLIRVTDLTTRECFNYKELATVHVIN